MIPFVSFFHIFQGVNRGCFRYDDRRHINSYRGRYIDALEMLKEPPEMKEIYKSASVYSCY